MRICVDIRSLIEKSPSGVTEYTTSLLTHLLKIDKENQYLLFYNAFHAVPDRLLKMFKCSNVEMKAFHWPNKIFNSSLVFLRWPEIDRLIGGVDLFFMPNLNFLSLSEKCKKVITSHDLSFERYPKFYSLKGRWWHKMVNARKIFNEADKIIAVSENTKKDLMEIYQIPDEKIKVIYSGVNHDFFQKIDSRQLDGVKQKYNLTKPFIFTLGNLEPRKNFESLILAFNNLRRKYRIDYQLVIAGTQAWLENKKIYQLAKELDFHDDIKFLGYVSNEEKPCLYQAGDIFVYPSFYEGFGFPPLEAMACGVPVICSFASSLPEILQDAALLVNPYNINEITEAIYQVLTDEELKRNLVENGASHVKQFFWTKAARETLRLFNLLHHH